MAQQKQTASQQMQTPAEIAAKRRHQQNSQRRQHQRELAKRDEFVNALARHVECSPAEIPHYAKAHGIPLYQG